MSEIDDLMVRLRAADPAAADAADRALQPRGEQQGRRDRASVTAARRRRQARRHARTGIGGGLAAFLGALAIGLSAGGGGGPVTAGLPGVEHVIAQAAHAAHLPDGKIIEVTSEFDLHTSSGRLTRRVFRQRRTQWIRLDRAGRVRAFRSLTTATSGAWPAGTDSASYRVDGTWWTDRWLPPFGRARSWQFTRNRYWMVPDSLVLNAAQILRRLQSGNAPHVELLGEVKVSGRRAYRLRITSMKRDPGIFLTYRELYVDA
ncbi:MAG TPA: hypothetical protein VLK58_12395, partial [Conexibacter sp.]|nr:hypothetical protein [Conexibacter sp.]